MDQPLHDAPRPSRSRSHWALRTALCLLLSLLLGLAACAASAGQGAGLPAAEGRPVPKVSDSAASEQATNPERLLVKFQPQAGEEDRAALRREAGATLAKVLGFIGVEVWELPSGADAGAVLERLNASPLVEYAEPDVVRRPRRGAEGGGRSGARP